jgi:hypothetical protein
LTTTFHYAGYGNVTIIGAFPLWEIKTSRENEILVTKITLREGDSQYR